MKKIIFQILLIFISFNSIAQTLPSYSDFVPGDTLTYNTKAESKNGKYEFIFTDVTSDYVKGIAIYNNKKMDFEMPAHGYLGKEFCLAEVVECEWKAPVKMFDKDSKLNDKWTGSTLVSLQTKTLAEEVLESRVEKFEKIKIQAGDFDAFKVYTTGSIKAKLATGEVYKGTLKMFTWFGVANNRLVLLKREYKNSFNSTFSQELAKLPELAK